MAQRRTWANYFIWGSVAVCAVLAASFTIAVVVGAHRGIQFAGLPKRLSQLSAPPSTAAMPGDRTQVIVPAPAVTGHDLARINDALRDLAAERDRLVARLDQIERSVGDITASINERSEPAPAGQRPSGSMTAATVPAAAPGEKDASPTGPKVIERAADSSTGSLPPAPPPSPGARIPAPPPQVIGQPMDIFRPYAAVQPMPGTPEPERAPVQIGSAKRGDDSLPPARDTPTTKTEFAIDLGSDATVEGLRSLWATLRGSHPGPLEGLRPLMSIRDGAKPGSIELRLVAGPLANAGAAARACAALQTRGVNCQTTVFDGQRLALR
jgi:hypothetical protein